MSLDFAKTCYCAWCGVRFHRMVRNRTQETCGTTHARKMTEWRSKRRGRTPQPCPAPYAKLAFELRGSVIQAAHSRDIHFYECACGKFHLTSRPNDISVQALALLREKEAS
jgi:hypothetical protein